MLKHITTPAIIPICLLAAACSTNKEKAPPSESTRSAEIVPGEAGGVFEETFTAHAIVREVDQKSRKVTLEGEEGNKATFTAPPEVRNLDQLKAGDKVKATITQRLVVFVNDSGETGAAQAAVAARTPKGAKPGAMVAESYELIAKIKSIDTAKRQAVLEFADGDTRTVPVREDVDLSKYKAGNSVVIRATEQLSVLVESPSPK